MALVMLIIIIIFFLGESASSYSVHDGWCYVLLYAAKPEEFHYPNSFVGFIFFQSHPLHIITHTKKK